MAPYEGKAIEGLGGWSLWKVAVGEWPLLPMLSSLRLRQRGEAGALSGPGRGGSDTVEAWRSSDMDGACEGIMVEGKMRLEPKDYFA